MPQLGGCHRYATVPCLHIQVLTCTCIYCNVHTHVSLRPNAPAWYMSSLHHCSLSPHESNHMYIYLFIVTYIHKGSDYITLASNCSRHMAHWSDGDPSAYVSPPPPPAQHTRGDQWCIAVTECLAVPVEHARDIGDAYSPNGAGNQPMSQSWVGNEPVCSRTGGWDEHSRILMLYWRNHAMPG